MEEKIALYSKDDNYTLYHGDMMNILEKIKPNSIDSVITDPPYELNFMAKDWDNRGISFRKETWEKCFEVLKPGGYLLAFGGSRTFHRIACAIEDAGFEIRDTIMWIYGAGMTKSMNIGLAIDKKNGVDNRTGNIKVDGIATNSGSGCFNYNNGLDNSMKREYEERVAQNKWKGWGTCLKPSYEPVIVARKLFKGSAIDNVLKYGVGGLNIDECKISHNEPLKTAKRKSRQDDNVFNTGNCGFDSTKNTTASANPNGRFPANTILTYDEISFDEVCGGFPNTKGSANQRLNKNNGATCYGKYNSCITQNDCWGDSGSAARYFKNCKYSQKDIEPRRYFYSGKASKRDRDEGLDSFETKQAVGGGGGIGDYLNDVNSCSGKFGSEKAPHKNYHTCVKPTSLMQYLVRLVTPNGGTILDPFNGSGSTGKAVMCENKERNKGYKYIGIELNEEYLAISKARIEYAERSNLK